MNIGDFNFKNRFFFRTFTFFDLLKTENVYLAENEEKERV